ncbi:MAG: gamma-glutamyl-gamma-aminobutyrate hydrolase family protein [Candidatus Marinimicrobia bacterium]|nr:gamma-glutamyl-gamma-aminobutyrate hydrolase family protein [Candidatus Neomarinimicrobiota bacterium]
MKNSKPIIGINMDCTIKGDRLWYRIPENYINSIVEAGGVPRLFPIYYNEKFISEQINECNGFLFMGGGDYPAKYYEMESDSNEDPMLKQRADYDIKIANMVLNTKLPVLGICGGCQLINIVNGGKMILNIEGHGRGKDVYHSVNIVKDGILKDLFKKNKLRINSGHHQSIDQNFISKKLKITAMTDDGIVEAIEGINERFLLGLQWHPERSDDEEQRKIIFNRFIKECKISN